VTRPYAEVIGDPILQSKSPDIHGFWLEQLGIDADYRCKHVTAETLADYIAARRHDADWRGCNVTMPHKQAVMPLLDAIDPVAKRIGAVNTIVRESDGRLTGYNTDDSGFLEPLSPYRIDTAIVVGAGGAARAVLSALAQAGVRHVTLQNRSLEKAHALLAEFGIDGTAVELGASATTADLLVNTSALGMTGQPELPALLNHVAPGGVVYDIVTSPLDTALLRDARARGLVTIDGLSMLIGQADHAFARFFGHKPPRARDAELRNRILAPA
jgi:shikimate dehydrogenase